MKYINRPSALALCLATLISSACSSPKPSDWAVSDLTVMELPGKSIRAVQAINDSTVIYAANDGQIGYTHNLGKTWTDEILSFEGKNPSFRAISKTDENLFLLSIESPAILYRINYDHKDIVYTERNKDVFYNALSFIDNKNGIAFGDAVNGCFSILLTKNAGKSWAKLPCESIPAMKENEVAFAASNSNIATYKDHVWLVTGGSVSRVFHSHNKGKSWDVYDTPIVAGRKMTGIYSVDFYNKNIGIIAGGDYDNKALNTANKALTKDGGKTWTLIADGQLPDFISCIKFVPNSDGKQIIAAGKDKIYLSNDQGTSWKAIHEGAFNVLQFINHSTIFLGGEGKAAVLKLQELED